MKVTLFVLTLNEIDGMKVIMPQIKKEWYDQLLIMDGHSTDGTVEYAKEHGYNIVLQKRKGGRFACFEALAHIEGDVVLEFSPDGNCIPELIPKCIEKMKEGYDMVIVSRYKDGAKSYDDGRLTGFGNKLFTGLISLFYGYKYTDAMVMYRAYKKNIISDLDLDKDSSYTGPERLFRTIMGWEPLMSIRAAKRKLKIAEIPGDEPKRIGGKAKLQPFRWGAGYLYQIIRELFWWK